MKTFYVLSAIPEYLVPLPQFGVTKAAFHSGQARLVVLNLHDFGLGVHRAIDDRPYGGGDGMVLTAPTIERVMAHLQSIQTKERSIKKIYLSAQGPVWNQTLAQTLAANTQEDLILLCGRYGGIDQRALDYYGFEEISIGPYILSGGELAAMVIMDSILRLLPNTLGNKRSATEDSYSLYPHWLEPPLYTRPEEWQQLKVPAVLLSGHHEHIKQWKKVAALWTTWSKHPELLPSNLLTPELKAQLQHWTQAGMPYPPAQALLAVADRIYPS